MQQHPPNSGTERGHGVRQAGGIVGGDHACGAVVHVGIGKTAGHFAGTRGEHDREGNGGRNAALTVTAHLDELSTACRQPVLRLAPGKLIRDRRHVHHALLEEPDVRESHCHHAWATGNGSRRA